jgi:hypothetical protein
MRGDWVSCGSLTRKRVTLCDPTIPSITDMKHSDVYHGNHPLVCRKAGAAQAILNVDLDGGSYKH